MKKIKEEFDKYLKLGCKPLFISFLHKKKCYGKFKFNFLNTELEFIETMRFHEQRKIEDYVLTAFNWALTEEGYEFWDNIHNDWVQYIDYYFKDGWRK